MYVNKTQFLDAIYIYIIYITYIYIYVCMNIYIYIFFFLFCSTSLSSELCAVLKTQIPKIYNVVTIVDQLQHVTTSMFRCFNDAKVTTKFM